MRTIKEIKAEIAQLNARAASLQNDIYCVTERAHEELARICDFEQATPYFLARWLIDNAATVRELLAPFDDMPEPETAAQSALVATPFGIIDCNAASNGELDKVAQHYGFAARFPGEADDTYRRRIIRATEIYKNDA